MASYGAAISFQGFAARISDTCLGGTYITLLYTVSNLGHRYPQTLALKLVDPLTWPSCPPIGGQSDTQVVDLSVQ